MAELKKNKKHVFAELAKVFPGVAEFSVDFDGSGDDFNSFSGLSMYDSDGKVIPFKYEMEAKFFEITDEYMWHLMDTANNQPDFNNDGSEGTFKFDAINKVVTLQVSYLEDVTPDYDGDEDDPDYEEKRDEYWDNMDERDWESHPQEPEIF